MTNSVRTDWRDGRPGQIPIPEEFVSFAKELDAESDRGRALSGTAYLDDRLGKLIESYLCPTNSQRLIWDSNAPLGTFSSRIAMTFALGLITEKERDHLNMLRKVRNHFAHNFRQKMDDPIVVGTMGNFHEVIAIQGSFLDDSLDITFAESPRDRFFHAVLRLAHQLDVRKWVIENEAMRLNPIDWRELYF